MQSDIREDLALRTYAKERGWTEELSESDKKYQRDNLPHDAICFKKENKVTWYGHIPPKDNPTLNRYLWNVGWIVADFIVNRFRNHRYYEKLIEVFDNE